MKQVENCQPEAINFCHEKLHLRFCGNRRCASVPYGIQFRNKSRIHKPLYKERFSQPFSENSTIFQTGFFSSAMWILLGGCFRKVFGTTFNNSKQVNPSGTNSLTYFNYSVTVLHFLVFVKKTNFSSLKTCFLLLLYSIHKKIRARSLN